MVTENTPSNPGNILVECEALRLSWAKNFCRSCKVGKRVRKQLRDSVANGEMVWYGKVTEKGLKVWWILQ